jgi:hypothetical protein
MNPNNSYEEEFMFDKESKDKPTVIDNSVFITIFPLSTDGTNSNTDSIGSNFNVID